MTTIKAIANSPERKSRRTEAQIKLAQDRAFILLNTVIILSKFVGLSVKTTEKGAEEIVRVKNLAQLADLAMEKFPFVQSQFWYSVAWITTTKQGEEIKITYLGKDYKTADELADFIAEGLEDED